MLASFAGLYIFNIELMHIYNINGIGWSGNIWKLLADVRCLKRQPVIVDL